MHPRKKFWFAKFNIMGGLTVERQIGAECYVQEVIKAAFRDGLKHITGRDSYTVYPPSRIISVEVEQREVEDSGEHTMFRGPRWNI